MGARQVEQRARRLEEVLRVLALECIASRYGGDPLLRLERRAFLGALREGLEGVERARAALMAVARRLRSREGGEGEAA